MWRKYKTSIILAITFSILFSMFWFFPSFAFIVFISILMTLLLDPVVNALQYKGLPRGIGAAMIIITFFTFTLGFLTMISRNFIPTFTLFIDDFPRLSQNIQMIPLIDKSDFFSREFDNLVQELTSLSVGALQSSLEILISLFNKFIDMVIIIFVTFYMLKDGNEIREYLAHLFPRRDYLRVQNLFNRLLLALRKYIFSQMIICALTGIVVFFYYAACGAKYASVFAIASGISEFIPVLGPTVASVFGVVMTATQAPWMSLQTMAFYIIWTQINHNVIYPSLIGKSLNLHPVATILGVILGGELLGAAGMFLAVPFMVICKILISDIYQDRLHMTESKKTRKKRLLALLQAADKKDEQFFPEKQQKSD